jgi:hypothetical protein
MLLRSWSRDSIVYRDARDARGAKRPTSSAAGLHISQRPWSVFGKKRGKNGKVGPPVHADLVERDFTTEAPNRLWLADITETSHAGGQALPVCDQGCVLQSHRRLLHRLAMKSRLATTALHNAVARRGEVAGCILHTDRGSQFAAESLSTRWAVTTWPAPWAASEPAYGKALASSARFIGAITEPMSDAAETRMSTASRYVPAAHLLVVSSPDRENRSPSTAHVPAPTDCSARSSFSAGSERGSR